MLGLHRPQEGTDILVLEITLRTIWNLIEHSYCLPYCMLCSVCRVNVTKNVPIVQIRSGDFQAAQLGNHPTEFELSEHFMTRSSIVNGLAVVM